VVKTLHPKPSGHMAATSNLVNEFSNQIAIAANARAQVVFRLSSRSGY